MNDLMQNLNEEQLKAVLHKNGPLLIVAGAGTGKTTVISQKIGYIIEQGWAKSDEILALTFTEKAAGEMEERVDRLLPMGYLDLWISTFHGFAEKILKLHGLEIGLPSEFKLLNEFEQWILINKNLDKFDLDYYRPAGNPTKFIQALLKHFSRLKDENITPADYLNYAEELKQNLDGMMTGANKVKSQKPALDRDRESKVKSKSEQKSAKLEKTLIKKDSIRNRLDIDDVKNITDEMVEQEVKRINEIANAYHVYQQLLLDNNAFDFGDLINYCLKLFKERPIILEKYRQQFKYVLVDEFQDTNWSQYELVKLLADNSSNLIVVGDDDQSIYRFRGASMSNILQFRKDYPDASQIILTNNYRNKQNILDLAYDFIRLNNPNRLECQLNESITTIRAGTRPAPATDSVGASLAGAHEFDSSGLLNRVGIRPAPAKKIIGTSTENAQVSGCMLDKKLIAQSDGRGQILVLEGKDLSEEIAKVASKIIELKNNDPEATWNDFAVLVRANDSAKDFCAFLDKAGLPYQFLASRGLYVKPIIMDIVAYLKLLDDYHESKSLYRILNLPIFDFTYGELVNFNYWANKKCWSLFETLRNSSTVKFGKDTEKKIIKVLTLISNHAKLVREKSTTELIFSFLNDSGYLKFLTGMEEQKSRESVSYLNQFMKRVQTFEIGSDDKSVKAFLAELNMEIDSGEEGGLSPDFESGPEAIKVMTIHASKGLEFKYVFIANMVDKRFPAIERRDPIAIPNALVKEIVPEGDTHLEEERRLFYVAATRAKAGLYLSWAADYGGLRKKKPSRFLGECGLMAETALFVDKPIHKDAINSVSTEQEKQKDDFNKSENSQIFPGFKMPSYLSYTQLAAFSNCPYQYHFAHLIKIPMRGKGVFSFGKTLHSTLQKLIELINEKRGFGQADLFGASKGSGNDNPKIEFEEILNFYKESWVDDWYSSKKQKGEYYKKGEEILKEFYKLHKDNWPKNYFTEKGFNLKINSDDEFYTVRGVMDRIDLVDGKLKIIDYKTGNPKDKLTFEEKEQLLIYQLAAKDFFKEPVGSVAFYYLDNNTEVEFLGTEDELDKIKLKIVETIKGIKQGKFPAKPSPLCKYCDFFDICEFRKS